MDTYRSMFVVFNNPETINTYKIDSENNYVLDADNNKIIESSEPSEYFGKTPEEICNLVLDLWCRDDTRSGAAAFCVSARGLRHIHMVLEDTKTFRFSTVKKLFPRAHLQPTRGNKQQAEDYIYKRGKWEEKGEQILAVVSRGDIKGNQGARTDLLEIQAQIDSGMKPREIYSQNLKSLKLKDIIRDAYFLKRDAETPAFRPIKVYYHTGMTETGKSYSRMELMEKYPDDVCYIMNYEPGFLDHYEGERILFLDEFRGEIKFSTLLTLLDPYKGYIHCRHHNLLKLWDEVHITSIIPPEFLYDRMIYHADQFDVKEQFLRRITHVVYHYKDETGFHSRTVPMEDYRGYDYLALQVDENGFCQLSQSDEEQIRIFYE